MPSSKAVLERIGGRVDVPQPAFERFVRRRARMQRNRRIGAGVVGIGLAAALIAALAGVSARRADQPATPDPLPTNGSVVYAAGTRDGTRGSDLYLVREEGAAPRRIVGAPGDGLDQHCPSFSPDGSMLAYSEIDWPQTVSLVVTRVDRSGEPVAGERRVTTTMAEPDGLCARWAPDSRRLLYRDDSGLWIATIDGSLTRELFRDADASTGFSGVWSPDGSTIAGWVGTGLLLIPSDGEMPGRHISADLTGASTPTWSPDGSEIAVGGGHANPGLQIFDVEEGTSRTLETGQPPVGGTPIWSPDGSSIAFVVEDDRGPSQIALADPSSGAVRLLPPIVVRKISRHPLGIWVVAWSPDGRDLLTIGHSDDGYAVLSVPADGTSPPVALSHESWDLYFTMMDDIDWQAVYP